jgi:hypothetical protein
MKTASIRIIFEIIAKKLNDNGHKCQTAQNNFEIQWKPLDTLASRTYLQLRHDIVRGRLPAGSKLRLIDLIARCGTGMSPVRGAVPAVRRATGGGRGPARLPGCAAVAAGTG